jgi:hypothetical protein
LDYLEIIVKALPADLAEVIGRFGYHLNQAEVTIADEVYLRSVIFFIDWACSPISVWKG